MQQFRIQRVGIACILLYLWNRSIHFIGLESIINGMTSVPMWEFNFKNHQYSINISLHFFVVHNNCSLLAWTETFFSSSPAVEIRKICRTSAFSFGCSHHYVQQQSRFNRFIRICWRVPRIFKLKPVHRTTYWFIKISACQRFGLIFFSWPMIMEYKVRNWVMPQWESTWNKFEWRFDLFVKIFTASHSRR